MPLPPGVSSLQPGGDGGEWLDVHELETYTFRENTENLISISFMCMSYVNLYVTL